MANDMTKAELIVARFAMLQENCRLRNENIELRKQVEMLRQKRHVRRLPHRHLSIINREPELLLTGNGQ
jgi:hypothetical protein